MLNQKHNVFKGQKSKSKIFITILCIFGLLFSYSCSCKNNVTGPGNDGLENGRDPNTINSQTFSASVSGTVQDTLRVDSQSQKKAGTEDIKISFSAAKGVTTIDSFLVTIEKVEVKEGGLELGTNADDYKNYLQYDKSTGIIRFEKKGLDAIGALSSATAPVDKIVSITFKIDGGEQGSDYITRDFHLIKIKKIGEDDVGGILQKMEGDASFTEGTDIQPNLDLQKGYTFVLKDGTYNKIQKEYTIKNSTIKKVTYDVFDETIIKNCNGYASFYLKKLEETINNKEPVLTTDIKTAAGKSTYTAEYTIEWGDNYESDINNIKITFDLTKKN